MLTTKLKNQVIETLKEQPATRNSDIALTIAIWQRYFPEKLNKTVGDEPCVKLKNLYELPREDNVKRVRAKLQEMALKRIEDGTATGGEHWYLPTDEKVIAQRQINAVLWKRALGYNHSAGPGQSEQLPRPVGMLGFSIVAKNTYLADGENGKKYEVRFENGYWKCECEAYRYSGRSMTCKHIKAIRNYLDELEKAEIARKQVSIF